mmetsp:Transcript_60273/g.130100  ORF Transcript_60273/g.130100 Transcript_60273/m.130100 type:complete len:213 (+) Transcript_60273:139-777(+)
MESARAALHSYEALLAAQYLSAQLSRCANPRDAFGIPAYPAGTLCPTRQHPIATKCNAGPQLQFCLPLLTPPRTSPRPDDVPGKHRPINDLAGHGSSPWSRTEIALCADQARKPRCAEQRRHAGSHGGTPRILGLASRSLALLVSRPLTRRETSFQLRANRRTPPLRPESAEAPLRGTTESARFRAENPRAPQYGSALLRLQQPENQPPTVE